MLRLWLEARLVVGSNGNSGVDVPTEAVRNAKLDMGRPADGDVELGRRADPDIDPLRVGLRVAVRTWNGNDAKRSSGRGSDPSRTGDDHESNLRPLPLDRVSTGDGEARAVRDLDVWSWPGGRREADAPCVILDRRNARVEICLPLLSALPLFYERLPDGLRVSNDLRLFARPGREVDPRGLHALFQFGAVLPPWSLFRGVERATPGMRTAFDLRTGAMERRTILFFGSAQRDSATAQSATRTRDVLSSSTLPSEPPSRVSSSSRRASVASSSQSALPSQLPLEDVLGDSIDSVLRRSAPDGNPAILFSGGVDSGLLAARASALGWRETLLLNYSRGKDDPESAVAESMAAHLGLRFVRVEETGTYWDRMLAQIPELFPFPFGDFSAPTNFQLIEELLGRHSEQSVVLDGAGADGAFGTYPKLARWGALYRLPPWFREALSRVYRVSGGWRSDGRTAQRLAWSRVSLQMEERLAAVMAENALSGIAYDCGEDASRAVQEAALASVPLPPYTAGDAYARVLDLLFPVGEMMAQKTPPLLVGEVGESVFPFLDPTIVRLGFDEAERARGGSAGTGVGGTVARGVGGGAQPGPVQKAALKQLLARHVPEEMVYRPKSGPAPPIAAQLARPATQEAFEEVVLSAGSPLRPWLDLNVVRSLVRVPGSGRRLPHFAHNFLWTVLVTGLWLEGANAVRMRDLGS